MRKLIVLLVVVAAIVLLLSAVVSAQGRPIHEAHVGTPDACEDIQNLPPGCDANFSLVALQWADGTVTGQYTDIFGDGTGFHATVDCLSVNGNQAWVSGVIKASTSTIPSYTVGSRVITRVADNGTSANETPDQISFSFSLDFDCNLQPPLPLFDAPDGQVVVR